MLLPLSLSLTGMELSRSPLQGSYLPLSQTEGEVLDTGRRSAAAEEEEDSDDEVDQSHHVEPPPLPLPPTLCPGLPVAVVTVLLIIILASAHSLFHSPHLISPRPDLLPIDSDLLSLAYRLPVPALRSFREYAAFAVDWQRPCASDETEPSDDSPTAQRCTCLVPPPTSPTSVAVLLGFNTSSNTSGNTSTGPVIGTRSTCLLPPPALLQHFYAPVVEYLPHLLTYRPSINCSHGRYLVVESASADGLGSSLSAYNNIVDIASIYRLQIIDYSFTATHVDPTLYGGVEPDTARRVKLKLFEWHVSREEYDRCPLDSAVKANTLQMGNSADSLRYIVDGDDIHRPLRFSAAKSHNLTTSFISSFSTSGFSIRFTLWQQGSGCTHRTSLVHAIRAVVDPHRIQQPLFPSTSASHPLTSFRVGLHIRRGDLTRYQPQLDEWQLRRDLINRIITIHMWVSIIEQVLAQLPWRVVRLMQFTVYSEGESSTLAKVEAAVLNGQRAAFARASLTHAEVFDAPPLLWTMNAEPVDSIMALAQSDLLIASPSDFSYAACMLNPTTLKVGVGWTTRWHGCMNHHQLRLVSSSPVFTHHPDDLQWIDEADYDRVVSVNFTESDAAELTSRILHHITLWQHKVTAAPNHDPRYPFDQQRIAGLSAFTADAAALVEAHQRDGLLSTQEAEAGQRMVQFLDDSRGEGVPLYIPGSDASRASYDEMTSAWQAEGVDFVDAPP